MTSVYLLFHLEERQADGFQGRKWICTYSTKEKAENAIERLRNMEGFRDYPERWHICERIVDKTDWLNGFDKETDQRIP
jgi:hypothetical protein